MALAPSFASARSTNRLLLTSITADNVNTAVKKWLSDSATAAAEYGKISEWDTSAVTSLADTFYDATAFNQNIGGWDTSAITSLFQTFFGVNAFNQDVSGWNTGAVTIMASTFNSASAFNQNVGGWNTRKVNTLESTFANALAFNQVLCWDTESESIATSKMFLESHGSTDPTAAKCACSAGAFYNGTACQSCPIGQYSNGKTESCYILPTPAPSPAPTPAPTGSPAPSPPPSAIPTPVPSV